MDATGLLKEQEQTICAKKSFLGTQNCPTDSPELVKDAQQILTVIDAADGVVMKPVFPMHS